MQVEIGSKVLSSETLSGYKFFISAVVCLTSPHVWRHMMSGCLFVKLKMTGGGFRQKAGTDNNKIEKLETPDAVSPSYHLWQPASAAFYLMENYTRVFKV